jgi:hypothetical protein
MREPSKQLPENQQQFETVLVSTICDANPDIAAIIFEQWHSAACFERWGSGAGFFTSFQISPNTKRLPDLNGRVLEAHVLLDFGVAMDAEIARIHDFDLEAVQMDQVLATLHTNGPYIEELECASFGSGSAWPTDVYRWRVFASSAIQ